MIETDVRTLYHWFYKISEPVLVELEKVFPTIRKSEFLNKLGFGFYIELVRAGQLTIENHDEIINIIKEIK